MRVGIVGDIHLPFEHENYLQFCLDVFKAWRVDRIHLIGDVLDAHALSFWDHNPNGFSAEDEFAEAEKKLKEWTKRIKVATVSIGNHDARHLRTARKAGIPDRYLRGYAEILNTPGWKWEESTIIQGVLYEHGVGSSGKDAAINRALQMRCSCVIGHVHSFPGVKWHANANDRIFGMNVGCGVDSTSYSQEYCKPFAIRPVLGCGIVLDGKSAYFEVMELSKGEAYHKGKRKR